MQPLTTKRTLLCYIVVIENQHKSTIKVKKMIKKQLKKYIIGQDHVLTPIDSFVKIGEKGLSPDNEPKGSFFFAGPTGTGKTETAKALSLMLKRPLIRFDMSEYQSSAQQWLDDFCIKIENLEEGIILLDEIEKGELRILDYFLQILSEGFITYRQKKLTVNRFYIIMTSNIGSRSIMGVEKFSIAQRIVERQVKSHFRPEFLGRFRRECILIFKPLSYDDMECIVKQKIKKEIKRLAELGYNLVCDDTVIPFLMNVGISPEFGARPLVQAIQKHFALAIINSDLNKGIIKSKGGKLIIEGVK